MSKNNHSRIEFSLKMTSRAGITVFSLIGIAVYLLIFFAVAFTSPTPMASWKLLVGGIGGAIAIGGFIIAVLYFFRVFLSKQINKNV